MQTPEEPGLDPAADNETIPNINYSEAHIRSVLAGNLSAYFPEELKLIKEEYSIPGVGRIDILAEDIWRGHVVIEIKNEKAGREAVGQLASYVGALRGGGRRVRGYLVAPAFDNGCIAASRALPNILHLLRIEVSLAVALENADRQIPDGFLPKTALQVVDEATQPSWTLNVSEMLMSSNLPYVSPSNISEAQIDDGNGINTNWGFVPFSEISLQGEKETIAKFVKRHNASPSQSEITDKQKSAEPDSSPWPFPKK